MTGDNASDPESVPQLRKDGFSLSYVFASIAVAIWFWVWGELDSVLNLYLLIIPIVFIPLLLLVFALIIAFFVFMFQARWRRMMSVFVAPFIAAAIFFALVHSGLSAHLLLLELRKSAYIAEVDKLPDPIGTRLKTWDFGQTGGAAVVNIFYCLVYDESGEVVRPPAQWSDAWRKRAKGTCLRGLFTPPPENSSSSSSETMKHLDGNFYLLTEIYQ